MTIEDELAEFGEGEDWLDPLSDTQMRAMMRAAGHWWTIECPLENGAIYWATYDCKTGKKLFSGISLPPSPQSLAWHLGIGPVN